MPTQSCANCGKTLETGPFISGAKVKCEGCGLSIEIVRADVSQVKPPPRSQVSTTRGFGKARPPTSGEQAETLATVVRSAPKVPGYELLHVLGRGGMGEVWRAKQLSLDREVAVKILAPALASDPDFVKRFEKEAAALAALSHPHIVQIIDRGQAEGTYFFTMEFVHGMTLRERMETQPLSPGEAIALIVQVCRAIDFAHTHGVVHRDLKPENILLDAEGHVKVADFGLAGIRDEKFNVTRTAMTMGTLNYMAPEQRKDAKGVDGRANLYSVGVMLYELLTGDVPVGRFKLPSVRVPGLDARLDPIVEKALETEPDERYQRASEVSQALEKLSSTLPGPASAISAIELPKPVAAPVTPSPSEVAAVPAVAPRPHESAKSQVERAGSVVKKVVVGGLVFLGVATLLTAMGLKSLVHLDETGLQVGRVLKNPRYHPDAGAERVLPTDTEADVNIREDLTPDAKGTVSLRSDLRPGTDGSLIALQGSWSAGPSGVTGRVFNRLMSEDERPRATLEEPSFKLRELSVEVRVRVNPTAPPGYTPKTPRAMLFFHAQELFLQLSMELGDAPVYHLIEKYVDKTGRRRVVTSGNRDFNALQPADNTPTVLRLEVKANLITIYADGKAILTRPVTLKPEFMEEVGRVGFGCEEGSCRFDELKINGIPVQHHDLGDDLHHHTLVAAPGPGLANTGNP